MAFDCGVFFNKLKRGLATHSNANNATTSGNGDDHANKATSKDAKDNRVAVFCRSPDWSEFEGVQSAALPALVVFLPDRGWYPRRARKWGDFFKIMHDDGDEDDEVSQILMQYYVTELDRKSKIVDFHHPHQLREMMGHCLDIDQSPRDLEQLLSDCKETLKYCVKTGHPHFFNQLSTGIDVVGLAGEWLTALSNTNMFTYEVAPVFTLMEDVVLKRMLSKVGWEDGEGVLAPGGAVSNFYGVLLARHNAFPNAKADGMPSGVRPIVFTSEQDYNLMKFGPDEDGGAGVADCGKMITSELEKQLAAAKEEGKTPIMVNAMAGSTVLGAFDPLDAIADICQKHGLWMHVDGAWGGSILLSRDYRHLAKGIERADSLTWNPHKMMGVPLQCSAILCRHKKFLQSANQMKADYLFQPDKNYDVSWDTGDKTIQCGRHNDIFKLWLMWRAKGDDGFETQINHNFEMAKYLRDKVKEREGFHLLVKEVAPTIKARMMEAGTTMVQYQPLGKLPNCFRVALSNPVVTLADLDFLVDEIERLGRDIPLLIKNIITITITIIVIITITTIIIIVVIIIIVIVVVVIIIIVNNNNNNSNKNH
nr:hypothetical protein BaRGS_017179 [Batillaria attramentaria]